LSPAVGAHRRAHRRPTAWSPARPARLLSPSQRRRRPGRQRPPSAGPPGHRASAPAT
jgi:hypothetical protein